jgi:hypothetical protein
MTTGFSIMVIALAFPFTVSGKELSDSEQAIYKFTRLNNRFRYDVIAVNLLNGTN